MEPVVDPEVAVLRDVTARIQANGVLSPAPLTTIRRRARRRQVRRRAGAGVTALVASTIVAGAVAARPGPSQVVDFGGPGIAGSVATGGTRPPGTAPDDPGARCARGDVSVYMNPTASQEQIDAARRFLEGQPGVRSLAFVDQQHAYEEFVDLFRDSPAMLDTVRPEVLPTSFRIDTGGQDTAIAGLMAQVQQIAGVKEAISYARPCEYVPPVARAPFSAPGSQP